jgi:hypothetical protein
MTTHHHRFVVSPAPPAFSYSAMLAAAGSNAGAPAPPGSHAALLRVARVDALRIPKDKNPVEGGDRESTGPSVVPDAQERRSLQGWVTLARKRANAVGFILSLNLASSRLFYIITTCITFLQVRGMVGWGGGWLCGSEWAKCMGSCTNR